MLENERETERLSEERRRKTNVVWFVNDVSRCWQSSPLLQGTTHSHDDDDEDDRDIALPPSLPRIERATTEESEREDFRSVNGVISRKAQNAFVR